MALVLLCVAWTLVSKWRHLTYDEAGAITQEQLWRGEVWRLFSATFLHHMESWAHLVLNGLSLWFVGRVIERALGRGALLVHLGGAVLAGFAASFTFFGDMAVPRMGISGGIAGLIGLLLAIEWCMTRSLGEFLRQRNTILILVFIAVSFPVALLIESKAENVRVDHAAHIGGFAFGLLAGLAHYTRRGRRPERGLIAVLVLGVLPIVYASHPYFDPEYYLWRGDRAYHAEDMEAAESAYARVLALDPGNPRASIRVAVMRDAPALLDNVRRDDRYRDELLGAYLELATRRLRTDPDTVTRLVNAAFAVGARTPVPWMQFGEAAENAGLTGIAYDAWREAAKLSLPSEAWRPLARAMRLLGMREEWKDDPPPASIVRETIRVAMGAAVGLAADLSPAGRTALEQAIAAASHVASDAAIRLFAGDAPRAEIADLARDLAALFQRLAENAAEDARRPNYRVRSAYWLWQWAKAAPESAPPPEEVEARFRAALTEAVLYGDPKAREIAELWFRDQGIPVPEPDLEEERGGR